MITESTVRSVSTVGNVVESSYTIEDSAKIFSILRSNIYSNKVLAVIREYSTNGWDGHIMAGTPDRAIQVTLPNPLNPVFKVRDFGVGMSEETVMKVYTSYGTSTKDSSNDFNGTFGLGSKSAFAYGNTFGITSFFNGTKTFYTAYLDETNIGKIRKEFSEPTTEENGIEIELSVKSSDIHLFEQTAVEFYRYFTPQPILLGCSQDVIDKINAFHNRNILYTGTNWSIAEYNSGGWRNSFIATVVMGNVGYPLNLDALNLKNVKLRDLFGNNTTSVINVPIGSVSITASREALEYDRKTQLFLEDAITVMQDELIATIQDKINSFPDFWDCCVEYNNSAFISDSIAKQVEMPKFKNLFNELRNNNTYYSRSISWDSNFLRTNVIVKHKVELTEFQSFNSPSLRGWKIQSLNPRKNCIFVLNRPGKVKFNEKSWRLRGVNRIHPKHTVILIDFNGVDTSDELKNGILKGATFVNLEDFDIVKYSTNRSRTFNRVVSQEMTKSKVFSFNHQLHKIASESWDIAEVDLKNGKGVYVVIDKYQPVGLGNNSNLNNFIAHMKRAIPDLLENMPTVYGIRNSHKGSIGKGWVEFQTWAEDTLRHYIDKMDFMEKVTNLYNYESLSYEIGPKPSLNLGKYWVNTTGYHHVVKMPELFGTDIAKFAHELFKYSDDNKTEEMLIIRNIVHLITGYIQKFNLSENVTLKNNLQKIESNYPGIGWMLAQDYAGADINQLKRYISNMNSEIRFD